MSGRLATAILTLVVAFATVSLVVTARSAPAPAQEPTDPPTGQGSFLPLGVQRAPVPGPRHPGPISPTASTTPAPTAQPTTTGTDVPSTVTVTPSPDEPPTATATDTPSASPTPDASPAAPGSVVVDHDSVALFERIPERHLQAAAATRMLFLDRSVGQNINEGLACLSSPTDEQAPSHCRRYQHTVPEFSSDPHEIDWSRPGGYDRSRWLYEPWSGGSCGGWYELTDCFIRLVEPRLDQLDVVSFQFSYLEVNAGSAIDDEPGGFFWDNERASDVYDLEAFEARHPDKTVIYWTTSLARGIGTVDAQRFNEQMRTYAAAHDKPLFDVADILSHDPTGRPCYDNRDGVPYGSAGQTEDYPDDGLDLPAICQHYTTEANGGHLGSVSTGKIRVAKAFWVLMARLAGWDGGS